MVFSAIVCVLKQDFKVHVKTLSYFSMSNNSNTPFHTKDSSCDFTTSLTIMGLKIFIMIHRGETTEIKCKADS